MSRELKSGLLGAATAVVLLALIVVPVRVALAQDASSGGGSSDVVILRCGTDAAQFPTLAYEGSTRSPAKKSMGCAENVSLLLKEGFIIENIGHYDLDKPDYMVITLIK